MMQALPRDEGTAYEMRPASYKSELVEVSRGTPMGELLRRYWHPAGLSSDPSDRSRKGRALAEDLILFRDGADKAGLAHARCCRRGTALYYAKVEARGIRCCYHGWLFDTQGHCLEQRCEPQGGVIAVYLNRDIALSNIGIYTDGMKLSAWAKANGLAYQTAWRLWRAGKLPIAAEQLPTGTVIVHPPKAPTVESVAIYARVSSADQKADLERQLGRLAEYASRERLMVIRSVSEIGCGLNGHRAKIMRLLSDPAVQTIVVEHRDRLARFGSESIEAALAACGRKFVVVDETEMKDDLVPDIIDVLTSLCGRLYGRRGAKNRAAKALAAAQADA